jgi:hypothetical protein
MMLIGVTLSGCAGAIGATSSDYCRIAEPVTFSAEDSAETVRQIMRENAKYACLCEQDCPERSEPSH